MVDVNLIFAALIAVPALCAGLCLLLPQRAFRNVLVLLSTAVMMTAGVLLALQVINSGGRLELTLADSLNSGVKWTVLGIDLVVLFYVIYRGVAARRWVSPVLAVIQIGALLAFKIFGHVHEPHVPLVIDYLSLTLILLVSLIGPVILVFSIGYMKKHEEHHHVPVTRQPRFFAILFAFLAVMNALAMADNLLWMYTFWEVTTLCSFLLIAHDETDECFNNAFRTLDLNMLGGVAFLFAIIVLYGSVNTISLSEISRMSVVDSVAGAFALGIALLCLAGFTKAAQFPFQSWLLGAMVAPTPVSALLHSSTMVKAGVYLIVRLAPSLAGSTLGNVVAFAGGFTFVVASAIAISQRNGKRVLAYSTIANLGLIICCAGIGTNVALGAAILLIIFHAVSKGLLFLSIGTIEQQINSRDIEDMQGLLKQMPITTFITVIGMMSMLLPPFGVLMTKWLAIESAVHFPAVLLMIILGSAFTVVVWAKWIGIILTMSYKRKYTVERLHASMRTPLYLLGGAVVLASCAIAPIFNVVVAPHLASIAAAGDLALEAGNGGLWLFRESGGLAGGVSALPLFAIVFALVVTIPYFFSRTRPEKVKPPYFGGELANNDVRGIDFIGPGDKVEQIVVHNYYLASIFGESSLTVWVSVVAIAILCVMFGVVI